MQDTAQLPNQFQIRDKGNAEAFTVEQGSHQQLLFSEAGSPDPDLSASEVRSAIILSSPQLLDINSGQFAALVTFSGEENSTFYCEWHSRIWISKSVKTGAQPIRDPSGIHAAFSSTSLDDFEKCNNIRQSANVGGESQIFDARKVDGQQEWCIA